jgi:isoquinoline 1-oxidoreductase
MPGVRVFRDGEFVAVLHRLPDGAEKALAAVKAEFDLPPAAVDDTTIHDLLLRSAPETRIVAEGGSLDEGAALAEHVFERTYFDPYVAHAPMEPHTALVEVKDGKATAWISTQAPFRARDEIAQTLNFDPKDVRVIVPFVGGGFGGKTRNLQAVQAARLAKAVGRPVQVAWTRADEFFNDTFRPASVVKIRSGMTSTGKIVLWDYQVLFAGERSSRQFYDITHHRTGVRGEWMGGAASPHPFGVGAWRAPASNSNTFARESQIDIMAATAGIDPVTFRLLNLNDLRMQKVLKAALERFGWRPDRAPSGRGVGVACADYLGTYVATLAEVEVVKETGEIKVKRVVCAQDMGQAINPEGARLQIEGCVTMGLGYSLAEEVHFRGGEVRDLNFDTYEIPRFSWVPRIETVLLDSPELAPSGGGEPAIITMGAVLANAVFDATGARITRLPLTRTRVQEARKNL